MICFSDAPAGFTNGGSRRHETATNAPQKRERAGHSGVPAGDSRRYETATGSAP